MIKSDASLKLINATVFPGMRAVQVVITQGAVVLPEKTNAEPGEERACIASCNRLLLGVPGAALDQINTGVTMDAGELLLLIFSTAHATT